MEVNRVYKMIDNYTERNGDIYDPNGFMMSPLDIINNLNRLPVDDMGNLNNMFPNIPLNLELLSENKHSPSASIKTEDGHHLGLSKVEYASIEILKCCVKDNTQNKDLPRYSATLASDLFKELDKINNEDIKNVGLFADLVSDPRIEIDSLRESS